MVTADGPSVRPLMSSFTEAVGSENVFDMLTGRLTTDMYMVFLFFCFSFI